jgi:small subunit ribosomal protein S2e
MLLWEATGRVVGIEWQPVTKLGRLVKAGKITSMEQIYLHSLPVKEYQSHSNRVPLNPPISKSVSIRTFITSSLSLGRKKSEIRPGTNGNFNLQIKPVQKQTRAGQRTRFKAIVLQ